MIIIRPCRKFFDTGFQIWWKKVGLKSSEFKIFSVEKKLDSNSGYSVLYEKYLFIPHKQN